MTSVAPSSVTISCSMNLPAQNSPQAAPPVAPQTSVQPGYQQPSVAPLGGPAGTPPSVPIGNDPAQMSGVITALQGVVTALQGVVASLSTMAGTGALGGAAGGVAQQGAGCSCSAAQTGQWGAENAGAAGPAGPSSPASPAGPIGSVPTPPGDSSGASAGPTGIPAVPLPTSESGSPASDTSDSGPSAPMSSSVESEAGAAPPIPGATPAGAGDVPPKETTDKEQMKSYLKKAADTYGVNPETLYHIAEKESNYDAGAVNDWDSNAKKGIPSKGLMQFIEPTFDSYAKDAREAKPEAWEALGEHDWMDWRQQAMATAWAVSAGHGKAWATYPDAPK